MRYSKDGWDHIVFTCNYNFDSGYSLVYQAGETISNCKTGGNIVDGYPALCTKCEYVPQLY